MTQALAQRLAESGSLEGDPARALIVKESRLQGIVGQFIRALTGERKSFAGEVHKATIKYRLDLWKERIHQKINWELFDRGVEALPGPPRISEQNRNCWVREALLISLLGQISATEGYDQASAFIALPRHWSSRLHRNFPLASPGQVPKACMQELDTCAGTGWNIHGRAHRQSH